MKPWTPARPVPLSAGLAAALLWACGAAVAQDLAEVSTANFMDPVPKLATGPATASLRSLQLAPVVETGRKVEHAGEAAVAQQTLRATIEGQAYPCCLDGDGDTAYTRSRFVSDVLVGAGSTGVLGEPTVVQVRMQMVGRLTAGVSVIPPIQEGSAFGEGQSQAELRYAVYDLGSLAAPNEQARVLNVFMSAQAHYQARQVAGDFADESATSWSSGAGGFFETQAGFSSWLSPQGGSGGGSGALAGFHRLNLSSPSFVFRIETHVGHVLRFDASLLSSIGGEAYGDGRGGWYASAEFGRGFGSDTGGDFGNGFDVELFAETAGVELLGNLPGAYTAAVPEPAAGGLFMAGLAVLCRGRLRRRARLAS